MNDQNDSQNTQAAAGGLNLSEAMPGAELGEVWSAVSAPPLEVRHVWVDNDNRLSRVIST